ncbi:MAG: M20 family metallopeptidase [Tissierellia bacterium]|nr:M20 family metallopeptidase [Tissierellia bacterium]
MKKNKEIEKVIGKYKNEMCELSKYIYDNPELGFKEEKSSKAHVNYLKKHGFEVKENYLGFNTAFRADYILDPSYPTFAFLSEYDALPEIGHGCGHNLLGATDTTAGIVLKEFAKEYKLNVVVLGTPAEETSGVKVDMAKADTFDDIDFAMCTHPNFKWLQSGTSMAMDAIEFEFFGKTAHAAESPHEGLNALDAAVSFYTNCSYLRQQIKTSTRIHGIIKNGGEACNIIPEYTSVQYYIRALNMKDLNDLRQKIINCAEAAAVATGCKMKYHNFEKSYNNMITNNKMAQIFKDNTGNLGIDLQLKDIDSMGSLDMGNVSQVVPSINPYFSISKDKKVIAHTVEFREATLTDYAIKESMKMIEALVMTAIDIAKDENLQEEIKKEFYESIR